MSSRSLIAGLPLATGSIMIIIAVLNLPFPEGAFIFEWMGSFLAFYGLSYLVGTRPVMPIAGAVLVAGSIGDITLLGGLNPLDWIMVNYIVFVHAALGALTGHVLMNGIRENHARWNPQVPNIFFRVRARGQVIMDGIRDNHS